MTDKELNELEEKAKAATPGPWDSGGVEVFLGGWNPHIAMCNSEDNAEYIAAANPAVILELITELKQARKERDWLANTISFDGQCNNPNNIDKCIAEADKNCEDCWIQAAKESTK